MRASGKTKRPDGYDYKKDPHFEKYVKTRDTRAEYQEWKALAKKRGTCTSVGCNSPRMHGNRFLCGRCYREADDEVTDFRVMIHQIGKTDGIIPEKLQYDMPPVKHLSSKDYSQDELRRYLNGEWDPIC